MASSLAASIAAPCVSRTQRRECVWLSRLPPSGSREAHGSSSNPRCRRASTASISDRDATRRGAPSFVGRTLNAISSRVGSSARTSPSCSSTRGKPVILSSFRCDATPLPRALPRAARLSPRPSVRSRGPPAAVQKGRAVRPPASRAVCRGARVHAIDLRWASPRSRGCRYRQDVRASAGRRCPTSRSSIDRGRSLHDRPDVSANPEVAAPASHIVNSRSGFARHARSSQFRKVGMRTGSSSFESAGGSVRSARPATSRQTYGMVRATAGTEPPAMSGICSPRRCDRAFRGSRLHQTRTPGEAAATRGGIQYGASGFAAARTRSGGATGR